VEWYLVQVKAELKGKCGYWVAVLVRSKGLRRKGFNRGENRSLFETMKRESRSPRGFPYPQKSSRGRVRSWGKFRKTAKSGLLSQKGEEKKVLKNSKEMSLYLLPFGSRATQKKPTFEEAGGRKRV